MPNDNPTAAPAAPAPTPAPVSKPAAPAAPAATALVPTHVQVRVVQQPVTEGGKTYLKNSTFFVTPERAKELGEFVTQVVPKSAAVPAVQDDKKVKASK